MKTEIFYLLLTAILTGLLWIPVVIGYVMARGPLTPEGTVAVAGELWRAVADRPLPDGARVKVVDVQGLTLRVVADDAPEGGTR